MIDGPNKLQIIYLYSIKAQVSYLMHVLDGDKPVLINALKEQLGVLSDTTKLFNDIPMEPIPDRPELKVV